MADDVKSLEMRIRELENQLKQYQAAASPQALTREEVAAYQKVSAVLNAADDWGCGINECRPVHFCRVCAICRVCNICRICINECVCGPCNICSYGGGAGGGFSGFGG